MGLIQQPFEAESNLLIVSQTTGQSGWALVGLLLMGPLVRYNLIRGLLGSLTSLPRVLPLVVVSRMARIDRDSLPVWRTNLINNLYLHPDTTDQRSGKCIENRSVGRPVGYENFDRTSEMTLRSHTKQGWI